MICCEYKRKGEFEDDIKVFDDSNCRDDGEGVEERVLWEDQEFRLGCVKFTMFFDT